MKRLFLLIFIFLLLGCCAKKNSVDVPQIERMSPVMVEADTSYYIMDEPETMAREEVPEMIIEPIMTESAVVLEDDHIEEDITFSTSSGGGVPAAAGEPIEETQPTLEYVTKGDITYVMQDSMVVGEISVIDMTVSKGMTHAEIVAEVESFSDESVITEEVRITPTMRAKLIDPSGSSFKIVQITPETQIVEPNGYTLWKWHVTPIVPGVNPLLISVDIIVGDDSKSIEVYEGTIQVISNETTLDKIMNFFEENWKYLLSTLLLPFGIFIYTSIRKRKSKG